MRRTLALALGLGLGLLPGLAAAQAPSLRFHSPAIVAGSGGNHLEEAYGCRGKDIVPPIVFDAIPPGTKTLELTMIDHGGVGPYAEEGKGFVHWHVANMPGAISAYPRDGALPAGVAQTQNGFGATGYGGPCPPHPPHRYRITVTAAPSGARYSVDFAY